MRSHAWQKVDSMTMSEAMSFFATQPVDGGRWHILDSWHAEAREFYEEGRGTFLCTPYTLRHIKAPFRALVSLAWNHKGEPKVCAHCAKKASRRLMHQTLALKKLTDG